MSSGDWRSYAAIAGLIAGVCAVSLASPWIASAVHRYVDGVTDGQGATEQKQQAGGAPVANKIEPPTAADQQRGEQPECNDLCAQRRMADAAEKQIWLSLLGMVLVGASLFLTGWAAVAATRAVAVAIAAERPRVRLSKLVFTRMMGDVTDKHKIPMITATIKNYGRSAATLTKAQMAIMVANTLPEIPDYSHNGEMLFVGIGKTVPPGEEHEFQPLYFFKAGEYIPREDHPIEAFNFPFTAHLYVYGFVEFLDHVGDKRRHGFCALYLPPNVANPLPEGEQFILQRRKNYSYDT